ncbi:MAG: enoyl-CoA hydratase/isomerase family protein [Dehalococcoidia bacterium]
MTYETILYESDEGVATITLNRPQQLNAVNRQLADEWRMALAEADRDERVRAVVITGAGRGFCAGQDLATLRDGLTGGQILREMYNPILLAIRHLPKPVIAAVNGAAVGAGMNLSLACDIRFAAEGATFGEVFARIGALPDSGAFFFLPRMVGLARAAELLFGAETFDARRAEQLGLVSAVYPPDELLPKTMEYARRLAQGPTQVYARIKAGLNEAYGFALTNALEWEAAGQDAITQTEDFQEGVTAFLEKRGATFRGR